MRLLIAERPERRHLRESCQPRVFGHDPGGLAARHHEDVQRQRGRQVSRDVFALAAGQVDRSIRSMDEHGPAGRADQPGDGDPTAVGAEAISTLAAPHPVGGAPAVELRAALAQPQHRAVSLVERERAGPLIHPEPLHESAVLRLDPDRQGAARDGHPRAPASDQPGLGQRSEAEDRRAPIEPHERPVGRDRLRAAPSIGATLIRTMDGPMGVTLTSTALPAIFNGSSSAALIRAERNEAIPRPLRTILREIGMLMPFGVMSWESLQFTSAIGAAPGLAEVARSSGAFADYSEWRAGTVWQAACGLANALRDGRRGRGEHADDPCGPRLRLRAARPGASPSRWAAFQDLPANCRAGRECRFLIEDASSPSRGSHRTAWRHRQRAGRLRPWGSFHAARRQWMSRRSSPGQAFAASGQDEKQTGHHVVETGALSGYTPSLTMPGWKVTRRD